MKGKKVKKKSGKRKIRERKEIVEKNKVSRDHSKQTKITVIIMAVIIASVFLTYWIVQESKKFEYKGMEFHKEKEDTLVFYKTTSMRYFPTGLVTGESIPFVLKLRNDPRELRKIPVEANIRLDRKEVILSLSPEIANCSDTTRTILDFSITLGAFGKDVSAGTTERWYSKENDVPVVTCQNSLDKTVIIMKKGEETKITEDKEPKETILVRAGGKTDTITRNKDCYIIELANCETQQGFERFIIDFIGNTMR